MTGKDIEGPIRITAERPRTVGYASLMDTIQGSEATRGTHRIFGRISAGGLDTRAIVFTKKIPMMVEGQEVEGFVAITRDGPKGLIDQTGELDSFLLSRPVRTREEHHRLTQGGYDTQNIDLMGEIVLFPQGNQNGNKHFVDIEDTEVVKKAITESIRATEQKHEDPRARELNNFIKSLE